MKKHDITDKELDLIFNHLVEQNPILAEDQVFSLLERHQQTATVKTSRHSFPGSLNSILITIAILGMITVAYFLVIRNTTAPVAETSIQQEESTPIAVPLNQKPVAKVDSVVSKYEVISTPAKTNAKANQVAPDLMITEVLSRFEKNPQVFSISSNRDTIVVCDEGTTLRIKANSFVSEKTGKEIKGNVQLKVKEYYKLSDILLARLSTTSDGKIIETGGMLHLLATSGNDTCAIKKGEKIDIAFPYKTKLTDMILFTGIRKNEGINWELLTEQEEPALASSEFAVMADNDLEPDLTNKIIGVDVMMRTAEPGMFVEEMPEFRGGRANLERFIQENQHYPYSALKNKLEGTVYLRFVVDQSGNVKDIRITKGLGNILDKTAAYIVSQTSGKWKPGKQNGQPCIVPYSIPIDFRIKKSDTTKNGLALAKLFEKQLNKANYDEISEEVVTGEDIDKAFKKKVKDGKIRESDIFAANSYILSTYQLGWINCDRFVKFPGPKTSFSVMLDDSDSSATIVSVIFQRFKSILPGAVEANRFQFKDVPVGEKITVFALKAKGNKVLLAIKEAEVAENVEIHLDFRPIIPELTKTEIKKLNLWN